MKENPRNRSGVSRRDFLRMAALGVGAGGALVASAGKEAKAEGIKRLKLTLSCSPNGLVIPLMDGTVSVEGVDINFLFLPVQEIFWRQLRHLEFDASEISFSSYVLSVSEGDGRFIGIPIFTQRRFRHSCVFINAKKGIQRPEDLKGKTVDVAEYQMTAALWLRGIFQHEYGVRPQDVKWRTGGEETPGREEKVALKLPPDIDCAPIPSNRTLSQMLDADFRQPSPSPFFHETS